MEMFLLTSYRLSQNFYTRDQIGFQGLIQGNGVASPRFLLIVIILIRYLYYQSLIPTSILPIINNIFELARQIFVDDSDFNIMNIGVESEL